MSTLSRLTTWSAGQVLTAAALNGEFNNIVNAWNNIDTGSASWGALNVTNNLVVGGSATITGATAITGTLFLGAGAIGSYKMRINSTGVLGLSVYTTTSGSSANLYLENDSGNHWRLSAQCSAAASPNKLLYQYNDSTVITIGTDGSSTWAGAMTVNAQFIGKGTSTNDTVGAGYIGEIISSTVSSPASMASTGTYGNITSVPLTAGDWDIYGIADIIANGASLSGVAAAAISINTGNTTTDQVVGQNQIPMQQPASGAETSGTIVYNLQLASPTTVYLKATTNYTGGPPQQRGTIWARRAR